MDQTTNKTSLLAALESADAPGSDEGLAGRFGKAGYAEFNAFLRDFRERLKAFGEADAPLMRRLVAKARELVPDPGKISPSWQYVWEQFSEMIDYKEDVFRSVVPEDRDGEWQVLVDNPYTHTPIACHPGLSFVEAAYLYAYFRLDLKPNELVRLQKILSLKSDQGRSDPTPIRVPTGLDE